MNERLTRYLFLSLLTLGAMKVLSMMLRAGGGTFHTAIILMAYVAVPLAFALVVLRPSLVTRLLLLTYILDVQFLLGMASMRAIFPLMVLCLAAQIARSTVNRQPLITREVLHPGLLVCLGVSMLVYLREPALPTLGMGHGSGFSRYVQYFCSFLPLVLLPGTVETAGLRRLPHWVAAVALTAALGHSLLILYAPIGLQVLFLTPENMGYFRAGRYSYLQTSSTFLFLAGLSLWGFGSRGPKRTLVPGVLAAVGGILGLFLTGTRTLVIGALAALLYTAAVKKRRFWLLGMGLLITVLTFVRVNLPRVEGPFAGMFVRSVSFVLSDDTVRHRNPLAFHESETLDWRFELWRHAARSIADNPLTGRGFSVKPWAGLATAFLTRSGRAYAVIDGTLDLGATHNLWLGVFVSFGIAAGIGFLTFVFRCGQRLWRAAYRLTPDHELYCVTHFLGAWMAMILGTSFTTGGTVMTDLLLLLGLALALQRQLGDLTPQGKETVSSRDRKGAEDTSPESQALT